MGGGGDRSAAAADAAAAARTMIGVSVREHMSTYHKHASTGAHH